MLLVVIVVPRPAQADNPIVQSPPAGAGCSATYRTTNSWTGGFQAEITATAGSAALNGWRVSWTPAGGQTISQVWNGTLSTSGTTAVVSNASYNGGLAAGAATTFGFLASGSPSTPSLSCTSA